MTTGISFIFHLLVLMVLCSCNGQNIELDKSSNSIVDSAPVATNILGVSFNEDTQEVIVLPYTDADGDLATACSVTVPVNVTETQACACVAGICSVGVTSTADYNGAAG